MVQRKRPGSAKRMVWRISEAAPLGEFVDLDLVVQGPLGREEPSSGGWVVSSFELLHGTDIDEGSETVPAELFDELFPPAKSAPKASPER